MGTNSMIFEGIEAYKCTIHCSFYQILEAYKQSMRGGGLSLAVFTVLLFNIGINSFAKMSNSPVNKYIDESV